MCVSVAVVFIIKEVRGELVGWRFVFGFGLYPVVFHGWLDRCDTLCTRSITITRLRTESFAKSETPLCTSV